MLSDLARARPDEVAVDDLERRRSWAELVDRFTRIGHLFRDELGLGPGDHVAMSLGNRVEFIELVLGALHGGVWLTPIGAHLTPPEIEHVLADSGASTVFVEPGRDTAVLEAAGDRRIVHVGAPLDRLLQDVSDEPFEPSAPPGANMFYTSGTTGRPKGVKRSRRGRIAAQLESLAQAGRVLGLDGRGAHLVTGPLSHAAPLGFAVMDLVQGGPLVLMPKWDAARALQLIMERDIRDTHLVPTMCVRLLHLDDDVRAAFDPSSLRTVLHGAAPIAPSVKQAMIEWWGPVLVEYWGASEGGVVTLASSEEWLKRPGTVGRPLPTYEVVVTDRDGAELPAGEVGRLWCRHRTVRRAFEYHGDPAKTRAAFLDDWTYSIGDLGWIDDDRYVYLADRESNMIITGGVNVYPAEVEAALLEHPSVADVAVFGVPDDEWGESVMAVIEVVADAPVEPSELMAHARERLAGYKVPRRIELTDALPRHDNGKLAVRQLRDPYWRGRDRQI